MKLKLPLHADDQNHEHIMWRIITRVSEVTWKKGANGKNDKIYKYADYPWFDKVIHGGFAPTDKSYQYSKGWKGQQVCIMNVIDREDNWCKENKHTKLLSKKISYGDDGAEFADDGVPSFGFCAALSTMVGQFGNWEHYDIQIRRTGVMQNPVEVAAATVLKKSGLHQMLNKDKLNLISDNEFLTPEELEYERYDIEKFFAPTSYQKLLAKLGNTIKAIDADLNTRFFEELTALADKEKADWEASHPEEAQGAPLNESTETSPIDDPYSQPIPQTTPVAPQAPAATTAPVASRQPVTRTAPATTGLSPDKVSLLLGWSQMTDEEKAAIVDVVKNPDGTLADIVYKEGLTLLACPETYPDGSHGCGINAPDFFHVCPSCGKIFG